MCRSRLPFPDLFLIHTIELHIINHNGLKNLVINFQRNLFFFNTMAVILKMAADAELKFSIEAQIINRAAIWNSISIFIEIGQL